MIYSYYYISDTDDDKDDTIQTRKYIIMFMKIIKKLLEMVS